jgi:fructokinase
MTQHLLAGIEAGGTKFICALASSPDGAAETASFPTGAPEETFARVIDFFTHEAARRGAAIAGVGVAAFGPVGVDAGAADYGVIGATPKLKWRGVDYRRSLSALAAPIAIDTDVAAAALAEARAEGGGERLVAYVTVGTGIGAGLARGGATLMGATHYELGHIRPQKDETDAGFEGVCPSHGDCLEGLACGPAIIARYGADLGRLGPAHEGLAREARYLAQLALTLTLAHAPHKIVFGGGVMKTPGLMDRVREETKRLLNGYMAGPSAGDLDEYITAPRLPDRSGAVGALLLAQRAAEAAR